MPQKNFLNPHKIVSAGNMASNITSATVDVRYLDNISIQLNFTGTPTGTFAVKGSVDNSTFTALNLSETPSATGSAATLLLDLNQLSVPYINVIYMATSGTGSLDVWVSGKAI